MSNVNVNINMNISSITYQYLDDLDLMDLYHQHMDITICARKGARASGAQQEQRKRHSPTNHMPSSKHQHGHCYYSTSIHLSGHRIWRFRSLRHMCVVYRGISSHKSTGAHGVERTLALFLSCLLCATLAAAQDTTRGSLHARAVFKVRDAQRRREHTCI